MFLSQFFAPTLKENPAEASTISHTLMLRSGMIRQLSSGLYTWLPLGLKVLKKVEGVIRFNMDLAGCNEVLMSCIQPSSLWKESGRYEDYGKEMLRMKDRHDNEMLFGPTHEEVITDLFKNNVKSYKELPKIFYQCQWKFRDEIRPRFGVMRGREFFMKDAYSFDIDASASKEAYELMFRVYMGIFDDLGLKVIPVKADNGAIGGDMSHEFHVLAETGESEIYYDAAFEELSEDDLFDIDVVTKIYAVAGEKHDPKTCPVPKDRLRVKRGIEVGHIFNFGTKYTEAMNASVTGQDSAKIFPHMGSYGIGISRLVAAIIEANHDDRGPVWPNGVEPFEASVINLKVGDAICDNFAMKLYLALVRDLNMDTIYDNTENSPGVKLANNDLFGSPFQFIISPKHAPSETIEIIDRRTKESQLISFEEFMANGAIEAKE